MLIPLFVLKTTLCDGVALTTTSPLHVTPNKEKATPTQTPKVINFCV